MSEIRTFETGATRDSDENKYDYEGFLSPLVIERFGQYMHQHRKQADGQLRDSDNWQKGIPLDQYMKSLFRHFREAWARHRGYGGFDSEFFMEETLCAIMFNAMGYLHEMLKKEHEERMSRRSTVETLLSAFAKDCTGPSEVEP